MGRSISRTHSQEDQRGAESEGIGWAGGQAQFPRKSPPHSQILADPLRHIKADEGASRRIAHVVQENELQHEVVAGELLGQWRKGIRGADGRERGAVQRLGAG